MKMSEENEVAPPRFSAGKEDAEGLSSVLCDATGKFV